jgi:hypothetical protein
MTEATKRLRDPAALALVAFVVVELVLSIFDLLVGGGMSFGDRAASSALSILDVTHVGALVGALVLVYAFGEPSRYAGLVTKVALGAFGVSLLFGVIAVCGALASNASGHVRTDVFLNGVVLLVVFAVGAWFTRLVYLKNAPAKPAMRPGWPAPQAGYQPWAGGQDAQQSQGYQAPPGGYGWPQQAQPMAPQGPDIAATQVGGHIPGQQAQPAQPPVAPHGDSRTQVMPAVDGSPRPAPSQPAVDGSARPAPPQPANNGPAPWSPTISGAADVQDRGQSDSDDGGAWRPAG